MPKEFGRQRHIATAAPWEKRRRRRPFRGVIHRPSAVSKLARKPPPQKKLKHGKIPSKTDWATSKIAQVEAKVGWTTADDFARTQLQKLRWLSLVQRNSQKWRVSFKFQKPKKKEKKNLAWTLLKCHSNRQLVWLESANYRRKFKQRNWPIPLENKIKKSKKKQKKLFSDEIVKIFFQLNVEMMGMTLNHCMKIGKNPPNWNAHEEEILFRRPNEQIDQLKLKIDDHSNHSIRKKK